MRHTKSKYFAKRKSIKDFSHNVFQSDFEMDDDDSSNIGSLSTTFLGVIIVSLTILLPSISVLIGRPLSQGNEIIFNHSLKKDGS